MIPLGRWDDKEKQFDNLVINTFKLYDSKGTCPMCDLIKKMEEELGIKATEFFFTDPYKSREHDPKICFVESVIYCTSRKKILTMHFVDVKQMAIEQYEKLADFVKWKEKN